MSFNIFKRFKHEMLMVLNGYLISSEKYHCPLNQIESYVSRQTWWNIVKYAIVVQTIDILMKLVINTPLLRFIQSYSSELGLSFSSCVDD